MSPSSASPAQPATPFDPAAAPTPRVVTVGHSTHSAEEFVALLRAAGVTRVVDVRSLPGSNRFPHFNRDRLEMTLRAAGIGYEREERLGGRRPRTPGIADDENALWRNRSFQRYADYALTEPFAHGLDHLIELTGGDALPAVMCAEAVWWRCHRRIIADHLLARGVPVSHLMPNGTLPPARLTPGARVDDGRVTYPAPAGGGSAAADA